MMLRWISSAAAVIVAAAAWMLTSGAIAGARSSGSVLPNGWLVLPPTGLMRETETMPQGAAASPDGTSLAVVTSGVNPSALLVYDVATLAQKADVPLAGAFGRPLWLDSDHVLVAGDNADALFEIDVASKSVRTIAMARKSHPIAVTKSGSGIIAVAGDGDGSVRVGTLDDVARAPAIKIGRHPGPLAFSSDGRRVFAAVRSASSVIAIDRTTRLTKRISTGLHPSDVLIAGSDLYVAASDADAVDVIDTKTNRQIADIFVGDQNGSEQLSGSSPNALAVHDGLVFVSLGAANSIAVLRDRKLVTRIAAGWYPTDVVPIGRRLYIIDGKGERTRPNPRFNPRSTSNVDYIGAIQFGSIRTFDLDSLSASVGSPQGAQGWQDVGQDAVVRPHGPIKHVFFILKENRSYDQVLGDVSSGNGDPKLVWFGAKVTPNQHRLTQQFGLFDNTYTSGEVSDAGHNWSDAAIANDFVERFWPPTYGGRRDDDDNFTGTGAGVPRHGYMWDAAAAAHVSFRDYGELATVKRLVATEPIAPTLHGRYDPNYVGWDLDYSDLDRVKEWSREFDAFEKSGTLPQLEYIWLPNDHTYGSRPGKLTPVSYVAQNDYAVGLIVEKISHSPAWSSSAVFIIEDDSQDGADHVSDQRTTFYLASPYARGGVIHDHYATVSVLRTIEIIFGMQPLTTYDAMAVPLYHAFSATANAQPFQALRPMVDITAKNSVTAFGARVSEMLDFSRPDVTPPGILLNILAHNRH
jgi:YVTN family beta-propeller protein